MQQDSAKNLLIIPYNQSLDEKRRMFKGAGIDIIFIYPNMLRNTLISHNITSGALDTSPASPNTLVERVHDPCCQANPSADFLNCRVYRSAEFCGIDHRLVVATLWVYFKTPQWPNDHPRVFHLDRLKERECAQGFVETISDRFTVLDNLTALVLLWDTKRETLDAAQESIEERLRARQNLISQETLEATDACCAARLAGEFAPFSVHLVGGQIVSDPVVVRERWAEYFELYQADPPTVNLDAGSAVIPLPDPPISENLPSLTEVGGVISKLKSGKAAGICRIPAELLKGAWIACCRGCHLAVREPGKFLAHILLRRIRDHLLRLQRPEQSGFIPGKSTIDLVLQVIVERSRVFGSGLLAAYIDLKKVFDTTFQYFHGLDTGQSYYSTSLWSNTGNIKVTDIADDVAILSESLDTLVSALDAFSNEAKPLCLEVSWTKTKIQDFGDLLGEPVRSVRACGEDIEVKESFAYLGYIVHNYGLSDQEVSRQIGLAAGVMNSLDKRPVTCTIRDRQLRLYGHLARFPQSDPAH
ncbi:uncharacterized protein [Penaeus vannamei]|uniref:uncharacterized protein n=1 Tax=Penaeus vannamei TaxID=6689 RepID=UPI00387F8FEB